MTCSKHNGICFKNSSVICLTPVKNESWILEKFLTATSLWADHIILADQNSDDGSREIAKKFPKVILLTNNGIGFNEFERQTLLINEARKIPGKKLLISLDADEILSGNFANSSEWNKIKQAPIGTVVKMRKANILPNLTKYWLSDFLVTGLMDDGTPYNGYSFFTVCACI